MRDDITHRVAIRLLGVEYMRDVYMNDSLNELLTDANKLVRRGGGKLASRQVIASLIVTWQQNHPDEEPIIKDLSLASSR